MELSSQDPHPMALDLSKRCGKSHLNPRTTEVLDLMKKPSWHSITDDHVSMPCMQLLSEKTLTDTGVRLSYGTRTCVRSPLLHNGMDRSLRDSGLYEPHPTESLNAESPISESIEGDESQSDSDVILLVSSSKEAPSPQDYLDRGSVSPLVDSPSPGAVSLGEAKGCFLLPQTLSSPSPDNTYSEDSSESTEEMSVNAKPVLNLSELAAVYGKYVRSPVDLSSDDSDVIEVPITNEKKKIRSLPVDVQNEKRLTGEASNVVKKSLSTHPRTIQPGVSAQKLTNNVTRHHSKLHTKNSSRVLPKEHSGDTMDSKEKSSSSEDESWLQPTVYLYRCVVESDDSDVDRRTVRQDPSESLRSFRRPQRGSSPATESWTKATHVEDIQQEWTKPSSPRSKRSGTKQKTHQRSPAKQASSSRKAAASKTKRRREKHKQAGSSSMFSHEEAEIKLKYANYKQDKRASKSEDFCPFVHMEQREYSACTVINDQQEEKDVRRNKGQQQQPTGSLSGVVPKTSCYRLGRLSSKSKCQPLMVCCLCGGSANAVGLGDLHGPYYPTEPALEEQGKQQAQREEYKDSELSVDCKIGLCGQVGENGLHELSNVPRVEAVVDDCCITVSDSESSTLPSAKKLRTNGCVMDGHSLPMVPHNTNECWIHEDCGIWSTGVFLVKGKLYGLEEAVRFAQETVCSTCHAAGATMGCFQKGCPNKYHYCCAAQSGCVLNEENFSMRCPKHKNKSFRGVNMPDNR
ncbi:transcription factor 20-like [Oncorhynchus nerka]|uniref:transcription factor 20-like n=1 Tax=Oncorhynchus nerka TaxID=8023 RepID=UPI00113151B6|nr:transcription factor 20-like [Oncorhynchus nerka]XP_029492441.1 transcription factor 20-like [Oncorhynchus nerka]